jgi:hypothetical protein
MAAPRQWDREILLAQFMGYIEATPIPIVVEFCALAGCGRQYLYRYPEFSEAIEMCIAKKEGALERMALEGKVNTSMAIFSLKQLGWKDTHEQTHHIPALEIVGSDKHG